MYRCMRSPPNGGLRQGMNASFIPWFGTELELACMSGVCFTGRMGITQILAPITMRRAITDQPIEESTMKHSELSTVTVVLVN